MTLIYPKALAQEGQGYFPGACLMRLLPPRWTGHMKSRGDVLPDGIDLAVHQAVLGRPPAERQTTDYTRQTTLYKPKNQTRRG